MTIKNHLHKLSLIVICILSITILFSGCGKSQIDKAQDKVVSIAEQFLDYKLTADEACEQIESIVIPETDGNGSVFFKSDVGYLKLLIVQAKSGRASFQEIDEEVKYIKDQDYNDR